MEFWYEIIFFMNFIVLTCAVEWNATNHGSITTTSSELPRIFVYPVSMESLSLLQSCDVEENSENDSTTHYTWQAMYSTEMLIYHSLLSSKYRTLIASDADLFFIPAFPSCHLHKSKNMDFSSTSEYLSNVINQVKTASPFFNMFAGSDHFMVLSHDLGRCLLGKHRHLFEETFFLTHTGDFTPRAEHYAAYVEMFTAHNASLYDPALHDYNPTHLRDFVANLGSPCFDMQKDIVIPPFTHIRQFQDHSNQGQTDSIISERNQDRQSQEIENQKQRKDVTWKLQVDGLNLLTFLAPPSNIFSRRKLASFRGSIYPSIGIHSFGTRQRLLRTQFSDNSFKGISVTTKMWSEPANHSQCQQKEPQQHQQFRDEVQQDTTVNDENVFEAMIEHDLLQYRRAYFLEMLNSKFCLCLPGFAPWTARLVEAVVFGCIPVIVSEPENILPFDNSKSSNVHKSVRLSNHKKAQNNASLDDKLAGLNWASDIAIIIHNDDIDDNLQQILENIPELEIRRRQHKMHHIRHMFLYQQPSTDTNGGAFDAILSQLRYKVRH